MGVGYSMRGCVVDGVVLFFIQGGVSLILYVIFCSKKEKKEGIFIPSAPIPFSFATAISQGVMSTLIVCGFVTYFSCILALCHHLFGSTASLIFSLFLEVSHGCQATVGHPLGLPLTAFAIGFSGISVHLQVANIANQTQLSLTPYLLLKCLGGVLGFLFAYIYVIFS